jgi:hypothetical protein
MNEDGMRTIKSAVWGVFLIVLGGIFLLERFGGPAMPDIGQLWPLVFYAIAVIHVFERRAGSALTMFLLGSWFLAVQFEWLGFTWHNSWPLALVAVGAGIVIRALTGEDRRPRRSEGGAS